MSRLGELVARERIEAVGAFSFDGAFSGSLPSKRERPHQAWVQISVGCNCVCAYCIVPSVRGRERSRPAADVVGEIEALAADGVVEVTLLGQNVNSYGRDLPREERATFAELLRAVAAVPRIGRVRYTSPHPKDMKADVIAAMAECPEVCEHLHLPAQSGSTRILKAMRRTYSRERYLDLVTRLREAIPDLSLTSDMIVGFPGETDDDFAETLSLVEEVGYDGVYTFLYSPRPGTEAAPSSPTTCRPRSSASASRAWSRWSSARPPAAPRASSARPREVLVEGPSRTDPTRLRGRLRQNIAVNFTGAAGAGHDRAGRDRGRHVDHALGPAGRRSRAGGPRPRLSPRSWPWSGRPPPARAPWPTPPPARSAARSSSPTRSSATAASRSPPTARGAGETAEVRVPRGRRPRSDRALHRGRLRGAGAPRDRRRPARRARCRSCRGAPASICARPSPDRFPVGARRRRCGLGGGPGGRDPAEALAELRARDPEARRPRRRRQPAPRGPCARDGVRPAPRPGAPASGPARSAARRSWSA